MIFKISGRAFSFLRYSIPVLLIYLASKNPNKFSLHKLEVGYTNCYLVANSDNNCIGIYSVLSFLGVIVDPGYEADKIMKYMSDNKLNPLSILLTHAHPDHMGAAKPIADTFGLKTFLHPKDFYLLPYYSILGKGLGVTEPYPENIEKLNEGKHIIDDIKCEIIHTPGHSKGSVCIKIDDILLSGDTMFLGGMGRVDLPGGSYEDMMKSLKFLYTLPKKTLVYPGHGAMTTIEQEANLDLADDAF